MDQEQTLKDILEIVSFMQNSMVTKSDLDQRSLQTEANLKQYMREHFAAKNDLQTVKSDIMTHMDGFIGLHQKLDLELVALRSKYDRLESYIEQLAKHANIQLR